MTDILLPWDIQQSNLSVIPPTGNSTKINAIDYSNSFHIQDKNKSSLIASTKFLWLTIYWTQFIICWFIIPVLISYISLKFITSKVDIKQRVIKAIVSNLKLYSLCLLGIIIGFVYLIISTGHSPLDFKPLLISLSHLYSLSYTLILLSSGLIMLPKDLLFSLPILTNNNRNNNSSSSSNNNNTLFVELSKTNEDLNDSQLSLSEKASTILNTNEASNGDIVFNELLNEAKLEVQSKLALFNNNLTIDQNLIPLQPSTINSLEKLNNNYNKFITHYYNYIYYKKKSDNIIHTLAQSYNSTFYSVKTIILFFCGVIAALLSILVLIIEILPKTKLNNWVFNNENSNYKKQIYFSSLIILSYNTICSLYAMSKFKFNNFHLIPTGNSNPSNVLYYSLYSSRLLFPLCFNLMTLLPIAISDKSIFSVTLYHDLKLIPFVNFLNNFLPICFMILVPISYKFDIKRKILLRILGEEYYYQFFGMMIYEPVPDVSDTNNINNDNSYNRINEDYEYSLQDGRYIYERASANFDFDNNSSTLPITLHDNTSTNTHFSTSTNSNNI